MKAVSDAPFEGYGSAGVRGSEHGVVGGDQTTLQSAFEHIFACSAEVASAIARKAVDRQFSAETVVLKQGDRASTTFLLIIGRARALSYGPEGQLVLLHEYGPGDFFGAIVQAAPRPERADVVAIDDIRAAAFLALDFLLLAEMHGCIGLAVSRMLLNQLYAAAERMTERNTLSAPGRVHAELLRLSRLGGGRIIRPAPVLSDFAVRINSTRETVSRTINALERRGLIRREPDALVIVAPARLEEMIV